MGVNNACRQLSYLLTLSLTYWTSAAAQTCTPVRLIAGTGGQTASIDARGKYCLQSDIQQERVFDIHAGGYKSLKGRPLLSVSCGQSSVCPDGASINYDIDLQGRTLTGAADNMTGVDNRSGGLGLRVYNGAIVVKGSASMGVYLCGGRMPVAGAYSPEAAKAAPFMVTRYIIERLSIRAGGQGVNLSGAGNVLRDSVIEVDGHTAAYLFGPDSVVENNTFIVHASGAMKAQQAALQLRDADRAIVRNNRFLFKGGWLRRGGVAISLVDSNGVTVEGNTVEGFKQSLLHDGASTAGPSGK